MEESNLQVPQTKKPPVLMIVLVVLLILSLGASAYLGYQNMQLTKQLAATKVAPVPTASPDPMADWKTYSLPSFLNFSFKYPPDWNVGYDTQVNLTKGNYTWFIAIADNSQHLSLRDFVTSAPYANFHSESTRLTTSQFDSAEKITVVGIPAIRLKLNGSEAIFFVEGNQEFYINYSLKDDTNSESVANYNTVQQIISTFKFTDPTADWKTYQINKTPYSFKYPADMTVYEAEDLTFFNLKNGWTLDYWYAGNKSNQTLEDFISSYYDPKDPNKSVIQLSSKTAVTINGVPGYKGDTVDFTYYFLKSPQARSIAVFKYLLKIDQTAIDQNTKNTFDQILSTFKFTQ